jgi:hypothetical protein
MALLKTMDYMGHVDQPNLVFLNHIEICAFAKSGKATIEFASKDSGLDQAVLSMEPTEAREFSEQLMRCANAADGRQYALDN